MNDTDASISKFIYNMHITESENKIQMKIHIAYRFEKLMQECIFSILKHMGIAPKISNNEKLCRILIHGSTKLRVRLKNSDIDVVLVLPNYISRNQWFNLISQRLQDDYVNEVTDIIPVIETFVPVIKLKFENVQFDMVISCLQKPTIDQKLNFKTNNEQMPEIYENCLDVISIRALSSIHIVEEIRSLIAKDRTVFIKFFRVIKIWTIHRELDSYIFGFPSAIAWLLMALYVYRCFIKTSRSVNIYDLLLQFFSTFMEWPWPKPVAFETNGIKPITSAISSSSSYILPISRNNNCVDSINQSSRIHGDGNQTFSRDNNHVDIDQRHVMPVMSLVYPYKNTAFTVRPSTLSVITQECQRAHKILISNDDLNDKWNQLFSEFNTINEYKHFISVMLICPKDNFLRNKGLIASRLRDYAVQLELIDNIQSARIHTIKYPLMKQRNDSNRMQNYSWIIGLKMSENTSYKTTGCRTVVNITDATITFYHILNEKSPYTNFQKMLRISYHKQKDIEQALVKI